MNSLSNELDIFITRQLSRCFGSDLRVPDFFSLFQPEPPKFTKDGRPYCANPDAYTYVTQDVLNDHSYIPKDQIIFDQYEYPELIRDYIENFENYNRIFLGYFPLADFFYFVADDSFILFDSKGTVSIIEREEEDTNKIITACDITLPDKFIYETNKVKFLLIYSTENSVTILPIGKTCDKIYEKKTIQTSFLPTIIKAYPTETSSNIFIGSNTGDVYGLFYKFNQAKATIDITIKNLTTNIFISLIPKFLRFTRPIINICYDSTTLTLAAIDSLSNIRFFKYDFEAKKLKEVSRYDSQIEGEEKEKIISINEIPISDSEYTRFVCITENGERLFFGTNPGTCLNDEILRLHKLYPPSEFVDKKLISGGFYLNYSIFVEQTFISIFHPYYNPHQPVINPVEYFENFDFEDSILVSIVVPFHKYQNQTFRLFYHELLWEHIENSPIFYLMCTNGYYRITLSRPVDILRKLIVESKGNLNNSVKDWMNFYGEEAESPAALLLLASENMKNQNEYRRALNILYQYSSMKMSQVLNASSYQPTSIFNVTDFNNLSPTCAGFIQRTAKLLAPILQATIFTKNSNDEYCLSPIFKKICSFEEPQNSENQDPQNLKSQLQNLINLSEEYTNIRRSLSPTSKNSIQKKDETDESELFKRLKDFLSKIIDILTFISIVSKQNNLIHSAMKSIQTESVKTRLSIDYFGAETQQISLYDALHEFAESLLTIDPNIYQLFEDCTIFFSFEERQILDVTRRLERNPSSKSLLEEATETYLKYIKKDFKLSKIVKLFILGKHIKGIIEVCLSKAKARDPRSLALAWYKNGRSSDDDRRRHYFNLRYECYKPLFDLIEKDGKIIYDNIKQMLESDDELFHICLYYKMLTNNHLEDLLSFTSPFIKSFLKEYAPDHRWIYSSRHKDYAKSARQLSKMIKNKEKKFTLQQRIDWLRYVKQLSKAGGNTSLENQADEDLKLAEIQQELSKRIPETDNNDDKKQPLNNYLLLNNPLFDRCCECGQWDLVLRILAFSSVKTNDLDSKIYRAWYNYFRYQLLNEDEADVAMERVKTTLEFIRKTQLNEIDKPSLILPIFENYRLNKEFGELWAVDTMLSDCIDEDKFNDRKKDVLIAYLKAFQNKDISKNIKLDFAYAVSYLVHQINRFDIKNERKFIDDSMKVNIGIVKKYLTENGASCKYYDDALKYLKGF